MDNRYGPGETDWSDAATLIVIPVLARPQNAAKVVHSIADGTAGEPHRVLFVANANDREEIAACKATGADLLVMSYANAPRMWRAVVGDWAKKINRALAESTEPLIFTGADDLLFHPGWLTAAKAQLKPGIGLVGTNDLGSPRVMAGLHATHLLAARWYAEHACVDGCGTFLPECYPHEFTDDEAVETAKWRGAWAFAFDAHVEHLHPNWGKAKQHPIYRLQRQRMSAGRALYLSRSKMWSW
jgi:hypothetical protein